MFVVGEFVREQPVGLPVPYCYGSPIQGSITLHVSLHSQESTIFAPCATCWVRSRKNTETEGAYSSLVRSKSE